MPLPLPMLALLMLKKRSKGDRMPQTQSDGSIAIKSFVAKPNKGATSTREGSLPLVGMNLQQWR